MSYLRYTVCMRRLICKGILLGAMVLSSLCLHAQERPRAVTLIRTETGPYSLVERSDWSRYDNEKYIGHVYHEVRAFITPIEADDPDTLVYRGNFFVLEETLRDMRQSAQAVDVVVPVDFQLRGNGTIKIEGDQGFPSLRGFPTFPVQQVWPGSKWNARGERAVDPLNTGKPVVVPFLAEYEYRGVEVYRDVPVHRIVARYPARYQGNAAGGPGFVKLQGSHTVDILLRVSDGLPLLMRDNLDETFSWADGSTVRFRGFTLTFGQGSVPLNKNAVIASLKHEIEDNEVITPPDIVPIESEPAAVIAVAEDSASKDDKAVVMNLGTDIDLVPVPEGIRLTIKDIRFVPDSAAFLPVERPRLDKIAQALKQVPERIFLVEGHTAATGDPGGEMDLSIQRAKHMVDELVSRGISADRLIYKGWGGTKPLGDNAKEPGRALNRRVEITILE